MNAAVYRIPERPNRLNGARGFKLVRLHSGNKTTAESSKMTLFLEAIVAGMPNDFF
jgi:hypothetical protein